jgi:ubiquinone/menaquinone biosynthesis C-methylase UbiE
MTRNHNPDADSHPWEKIFATDGRVFTEELPALQEASAKYKQLNFHRLLDLGCGNGRHVVAFAKLGFDVIGLDISRSGLDLTDAWLQEEGLSALLLQADTRHPLPLKENSIDGLLSTQVIHHAYLQQVTLAIAEIHRILKPGGVAFVTVPRSSYSQKKSKKLEKHTYLPLEGPEAGLPHHIFSERRLREAFQSFHVLEVSYRDQGRLLAIWAEKPSSP